MTNELLSQEEIEVLLQAQDPDPAQPELETRPEQETEFMVENEEPSEAEQPANNQALLTEKEMDALGEVGNICMGSSSTTLSLQLNQPVNITSPRVTYSTLEELYRGFNTPLMSIRVNFTQGLSGGNLLVMKLDDTAVLADLMMGGDGANISEEISEIGISAAAEAMNQMIGSAATAMATMFNRTVNISPPETKIFKSQNDLTYISSNPVVVIWFKMTIGSILDTQLMQVMDMVTAREEADLILGQLVDTDEQQELPVQEPPVQEEPPNHDPQLGREQQVADRESANDSLSLQQQARQQRPVVTVPEARSAPIKSSELEHERLQLILDIPLKVTVVLGRTKWPIKDILELTPGSVVELQCLVNEPVEILVNGTLVAKGEVVVVNENFGVRITNIINPEERLQYLGR